MNDDKEDVNDSVNDSDSEDYPNEMPFADISNEFKDSILEAKKSLYYAIMFGPKLGTPEAQSLTLIDDYLQKLNELYILTDNIKKNVNVINTRNLELFPFESRKSIEFALQMITKHFNLNKSVEDRGPYESYVYNILKKYQYVFKNNE